MSRLNSAWLQEPKFLREAPWAPCCFASLEEVLSLNTRWMSSAKLIWGIFFCALTKATRLVLLSIADDRSLGCSVCPGVGPPAADSKGFVQAFWTSHCWSCRVLIAHIAAFNADVKEAQKNDWDRITAVGTCHVLNTFAGEQKKKGLSGNAFPIRRCNKTHAHFQMFYMRFASFFTLIKCATHCTVDCCRKMIAQFKV